ncbi:putative sporulation protein YtxC [Intestinibacter sp.]|uniref:putative sporulation protein YtxC n=1 Tax=Intestinibacter sp. TaxID=1965304 RepID=UPI003F13F1D2
MTNKKIHINYLPQHDDLVNLFMKDNSEKYIICNQQLRDLVVNVDMENKEETINKIIELILIILKNKNLKEYIWNNYRNLNDEEKDKVYLEAKYLLDKKEAFIINTIYNKLVEFIDTGESLNIDGFFRFRMRDFMVYISIISDIALEEYLIKRDKNQFINTLKYFIESQDSKIDLLIIHIMQDGNFKFYDQYGIEINDNNTEEMISMIIKDDLNYEDFLISTLINLCPKRIEIIDNLRDEISEEIIENIKIIFENNVKVTFKQ